MKRLLSLALILMLSLSLVGCLPFYILGSLFDSSEYTPLDSNEHVITAGKGDISDEDLVEVINAYEYSCEPIAYEGDDSTVSFEVDFKADVAYVSRLSTVRVGDPEFELDKYVDTAPEVDVNGKQITVHLHRFSNSEITRNPIWSYLVAVRDGDGKEHYYYFRVDHIDHVEPLA